MYSYPTTHLNRLLLLLLNRQLHQSNLHRHKLHRCRRLKNLLALLPQPWLELWKVPMMEQRQQIWK
jgi:hypothetical protein